MKRTIRFRCWDSANKQMIPHELLGVCLKNINKWGRNYSSHLHYLEYINLDAAEQEIYEGDFIEYELLSQSGYIVTITCEVSKSKYGWSPFTDPAYSIDKAKNLKVVGNIYQTPNLINSEANV